VHKSGDQDAASLGFGAQAKRHRDPPSLFSAIFGAAGIETTRRVAAFLRV
jgi:hypothetical protein